MSHIQLYARVDELIPTEPPIIRWGEPESDLWKSVAEETGCPTLNAAEYFPQFMQESLKRGAPDFALCVHPNGIIGDGNFRYHWWRWAQMRYLPINLDYFLCNSTDEWLRDHPYMGHGSAGKERTTFHLPRHLKTGYHNWWMLEAREFLDPFVKLGAPRPEFNLSYKACAARLER